MNPNIKKLIIAGVIVLLSFVIMPFMVGYNSAGYRTVIQHLSGNVEVVFKTGFYLQIFGKVTEYPDIVTVNFTKDNSSSSIDIDPINIRFNDRATGTAEGIVKLVLPRGDKQMLQLHTDYRSLENVGITGFKPFVKECLLNSAQLMSSSMHYSGGRSTMSQYFQDQLESGVYILTTKEKITYDSVEKEKKRVYLTTIELNSKGNPIRKKSVLELYNIGINDASISDVDYSDDVDKQLKQLTESQSKTIISKQKLMQAQQEALTAKVEGEKNLITTEYEAKKSQTQQIVEAQTTVKLATEDLNKQKIAYQAAALEAKKIKELADAEAYRKKRIMDADGALELRLTKMVEMNQAWAKAFAENTSPLVPQNFVTMGGGNSKPVSSIETMMQMMAVQQAYSMNQLSSIKK